MQTRSTLKLKELIFGVLNSDITLRGLLGGTGRVRHESPQQLSEYPLVVYAITSEEDSPYNEDLPTNITKASVRVETFSSTSNSAQADSIDDRVFSLLHGQKISNTAITVYSCYRASRIAFFESEVNVWKIESVYNIYSSYNP